MGRFWKDFEKRMEHTAEHMTRRAGEAMEIQKLKSQIHTWEKENNEDLTKLGTILYEQYQKKNNLTETSLGLCDAIWTREKSIREYQRKISELRGRFPCGDCGRVLTQEMQYCPHCGAKITEEMKEKAEDYMETIREKTENMREKTADLRHDLSHKAAETLSEAGSRAKDAAKTFEDKADSAVNTLEGKVGSAADTLEDKAESISDTIQEKAKEAAKRLRGME